MASVYAPQPAPTASASPSTINTTRRRRPVSLNSISISRAEPPKRCDGELFGRTVRAGVTSGKGPGRPVGSVRRGYERAVLCRARRRLLDELDAEARLLDAVGVRILVAGLPFAHAAFSDVAHEPAFEAARAAVAADVRLTRGRVARPGVIARDVRLLQ